MAPLYPYLGEATKINVYEPEETWYWYLLVNYSCYKLIA